MAFDDLTLPEWAAGQLSNILQIQDQSTAKNALLQVILSLKDAASLPHGQLSDQHGPFQCMKLSRAHYLGMIQCNGP